jgi:hypothetical protein
MSRRSGDMKPSMKAMPGTVPPLTSFCLACVVNRYDVQLTTEPHAVPLPIFQNRSGYCWYTTGAGKNFVRNIGSSQAKDCPQAMAHLGSGYWIRHLGRMREARSLANQQRPSRLAVLSQIPSWAA